VPKKLDPKVAQEIMLKGGWRPLEPYKSALKPWKCECIKCGHVGTPQFSNVQRGSGCTVCKNSEKEKPSKILDVKAEEIMKQAGMKPLEPYVNSKTPWKSKCMVCKKITSPALGNVIQGHNACAYCTGHKVDPKDAILVMKKANLEPLEPFTSVDKAWKCKCLKCGEVVQPAYASIKRGQGGCLSCGREATASSHRYTHEMTYQTMKEANLEPLEPYKASDTPWKCRCMVCQKIVYPMYSNINSGNSGCLYCVGAKVDEEDAIALMRKFGLEPLEPYIDSKKKWKSRHLKCGNIVYPQYNTIQNRGGGCSTCAEHGLTYNAPAYLYIIQHVEYQSIKVGISNIDATPNRVRSHEIDGWKLYKSFNFGTGQTAEDVENDVLTWLRQDKGLGVHLSKEMMRQGGYSETVDANEISVLEIEKFIKGLIKGLQK
jgi:hypothetical protein